MQVSKSDLFNVIHLFEVLIRVTANQKWEQLTEEYFGINWYFVYIILIINFKKSFFVRRWYPEALEQAPKKQLSHR